MGLSAGRPTGLSVPFRGQPVQGHSGIRRMADGTFWVLTDNGFGSKRNSPDAMLFLSHYRFDFEKGTIERIATVFLSDPDKKVPFRIANEGTERRYLTGADFDPESFQIINGKIWIGEEFGPFLIRADMSGKIEAIFETQVDGQVVRSPDHPAVTTPNAPGGAVDFRVRRSKGFEGMAASPDGRFLYPLLEGALWDPATRGFEQVNGREYLRILEFDVQAGRYTGRHWKYVLDENGLSIGDFNMIDATTGLIIERDDNEGVPERACPAGQRAETCFHALPRIKRVWKIEMTDANAGNAVRKIGFIDLLKIRTRTIARAFRCRAATSRCRSSPSRMSRWWMPTTSWWATTTTCPSRPAATPTRPTATRWCCCACRSSCAPAEGHGLIETEGPAPCRAFCVGGSGARAAHAGEIAANGEDAAPDVAPEVGR